MRWLPDFLGGAMKIGSKTAGLVLLAMSLSSGTLRADVTGSIAGVVRDRSQAVVTGARVRVTNSQTNLSQETTTVSDGSFKILALPVVLYQLTATASGFAPYTATDIDLKVNDQLHFDITLKVGSLQEQVSVETNPVQVETEST